MMLYQDKTTPELVYTGDLSNYSQVPMFSSVTFLTHIAGFYGHFDS